MPVAPTYPILLKIPQYPVSYGVKPKFSSTAWSKYHMPKEDAFTHSKDLPIHDEVESGPHPKYKTLPIYII